MYRGLIAVFVLKVISIVLSFVICILKVAQLILKERHRRETAKIDARIREIEEEIRLLEEEEALEEESH